MSTGDFIKGFHKISDLLTETQKTDIENYAYQYAKFHRVYFKVLKVDDENKKIIVQAKQNKHSFTNPYFTEPLAAVAYLTLRQGMSRQR